MSSKKIVFVGLDVEDTAFQGAGLVRQTGELLEFNNAGHHCDIVAPSLIPMKSEVRIKTDRLDAAKLAQY